MCQTNFQTNFQHLSPKLQKPRSMIMFVAVFKAVQYGVSHTSMGVNDLSVVDGCLLWGSRVDQGFFSYNY